MIRGIYTAVSGLITQEAKQDVISNNLANVNTVGFKGDNLAIKKFDDVLLQNFDKIENGQHVRQELGGLSMGSRLDETDTDFTQGTIQGTDKWTDFAIDGRGFFTVRRNDGIGNQDFYTRDGHFHVNSEGFMVNDSGDRILGINNATNQAEPIFVGSGKLSKGADGNFVVTGNANAADNRTYKMRVVDFTNEQYKGLQKVGDNLYSLVNNGNAANPTAGVTAENPPKPISVVQNSLEKSNVNVVNEMVNMMTVMRTFETNQKIVQTMDETLGKVINEVGSVR